MARTTKKLTRPKLTIAGIGASAGGLEALSLVVSQLPPRLDLSIVIVQHLDPNHPSELAKILAKKSKLPVIEVEDRMKLTAGKIFVAPPNHWVNLKNGALRLSPREDLSGPPQSIDHFFESLAKDRNFRKVGILLSGKATDGTLGLREIRKHGGISVVQDPASAKHPGMPHSAIDAGVADSILTPKQIGKRLAEMARYPDLSFPEKSSVRSRTARLSVSEAELDPIFAILRNQFQADFSHYKQTTLKRRIERRMAILKKAKLEDYLHTLESNPQEIRALFDDLLIKVTEFFRDPKSFVALKKKVLSKILKTKLQGAPIRVWIAGCATGEEAYSVAMSLVESIEESGRKISLQIFATDISDAAIQTARAGIYPHSISENFSQERLNRFFTQTETGYKIKKEIREICLFSRHDLTQDPPFVKIDLICCRNLLIYFDSSLQKRVLPVLLYALNPGGFLWLGRSESVGRLSSLFRVADKTHRFYYREKNQIIPRLDFPTRTFWTDKPELSTYRPTPASTEKPEIQHHAEELLLAEYAPPGVVINSRNEILLAKGDTSAYLQLPRGTVSLNLFKMARPEIVSELRMVIQSAKKKNSPTKKKGIVIHEGDRKRLLTITVFPLEAKGRSPKQDLLVLFEKVAESETLIRKNQSRNSLKGMLGLIKNQRIQELEEELAEAKSYQQSLVEDFEATQEEITSTNEELQSANEELQSTIEELETAKEELQSTNEELISVNEEMRNRNTELLQLNNDLVNLLGSVDLPIVMLGADGRIRRFTPRASQFFNLIPSDIGRSIGDVKPNFDSPDLQKLVADVTESMILQEHEVRNSEDRWFRLQVRPYKTTDHRIDGAVISLIDITYLKQSLIESQTAVRYAAAITDNLPDPLVVLDESLRILSANQEFCRVFRFDSKKQLGSDFLSTIHGSGTEIRHLSDLIKNTLGSGIPLRNFEVTDFFYPQGQRTIEFNAQQIKWLDPLPKAILLSLKDITERRGLETDLKSSQERFRILIESAHDAILIVDQKGLIEFANTQAKNWFGYGPAELNHQLVENLIPERFRKNHIAFRDQYSRHPVPRAMSERPQLWGLRKDGTEFPVEISLSPIHLNGTVHVAVMIRDITERQRLAEDLKVLFDQEKKAHFDAENARAEAVRANEAKDVFLAILSHELRTPLTSILVWAQLLKRGVLDPEKLKKGLNTIEESAQAQGQLINDLIDVSRIQSGKLSLTLSEIEPLQVVTAAIESVLPIANAKNIQIELHDELTSGKIYGDTGRVQQILWNLITNSIKFSSYSSSIEVRIFLTQEHNKDYVSLEVMDHGSGIDPKFLPYLFTRFSQQDSTITRTHGGLGIGLALVHDLTKAHGGFVKAESAGPEHGATFTVYLPLIQDTKGHPDTTPKKTLESPSTHPDLTGLRVLIVDDEPGSLEAFVETVQLFGGDPIRCISAKEAWTQFRAKKPDVIVSDIAMPIEDGYELLRKIRSLPASEGGDVPALALTAFAAHHDIERALAAGFQEHLSKPVNSGELGHAILRLAHKKAKK